MSAQLNRALDLAIEACCRLMMSLMQYRRRGLTGSTSEMFVNLDHADIAVGNLNLELLHHIKPDDSISK